jgi:hypothetical protein
MSRPPRPTYATLARRIRRAVARLRRGPEYSVLGRLVQQELLAILAPTRKDVR